MKYMYYTLITNHIECLFFFCSCQPHEGLILKFNCQLDEMLVLCIPLDIYVVLKASEFRWLNLTSIGSFVNLSTLGLILAR